MPSESRRPGNASPSRAGSTQKGADRSARSEHPSRDQEVKKETAASPVGASPFTHFFFFESFVSSLVREQVHRELGRILGERELSAPSF